MHATDSFLSMPDGIRLFARTIAGPSPTSPTLLVPNGVILLDDLAPLAATHRIVAYDMRNRGASDASPTARGIPDDVADLEAVRTTLGIERCATLAHSYVSLVAIRHAMLHPAAVDRVVMIGAPPPEAGATYPPELAYADDVLPRAFAELGRLQTEDLDPMTRFHRAWEALRPIYVVDPARAERLRSWERAELPNEHVFMAYFGSVVMPSIAAIAFTRDALAAVTARVLLVHGTKDRSAPLGGARDWVTRLPHAQLVEVPNAGHAPWIEDASVLDEIARFLRHS